jgi:hypothetical protein
MTGQIAFARTLRALDADNFRAPKMGLFFAIAVLAAWTWWFLTPSIPDFSELAQNSALQWSGPHHVATTDLRAESFFHPKPGQAARLRFEGRTINASVVGSFFTIIGGYQSRFLALEVPSTIQPPLPSRGNIDVLAGRVSPATLLTRALYR